MRVKVDENKCVSHRVLEMLTVTDIWTFGIRLQFHKECISNHNSETRLESHRIIEMLTDTDTQTLGVGHTHTRTRKEGGWRKTCKR